MGRCAGALTRIVMLCNELFGRRERRKSTSNSMFLSALVFTVGRAATIWVRIDGKKLRSRSQIVSRAIVCQQRKPSSQAGLGILTATQGTVYCHTEGAG